MITCKIPLCTIVFERCTYQSALGFSFEARHGERFVDFETCSLCLCDDGEAEFCVQANENLCTRANGIPARDTTCSLEGETLDDGETMEVSDFIPVLSKHISYALRSMHSMIRGAFEYFHVHVYWYIPWTEQVMYQTELASLYHYGLALILSGTSILVYCAK